MFLSNPRKSFLLALFFGTLFQACSSPESNENKPVSLNVEIESEFPFSTKEPEVYQGDLIVRYGDYEEHKFVARKGALWRLDFYLDGEKKFSELKLDKVFSIDHVSRVYAEASDNVDLTTDPNFFSNMTDGFFKGKEYREFEEIGRSDGAVKYRVRKDATSKDEIFIDIDAASGMIVRQEFLRASGESGLRYEVRNLRLEVDDSVFALPDTYRKVTWNEYRHGSNKN